MFRSLDAVGIILLLPISTLAQNILCIPGQCLQGTFNTTIGVTVANSANTSSIHLLPGVYTSTSNPQLLHDLISSSTPSITSTPGFRVSSPIPLPLNLQVQPGLSLYANPLYSGVASFMGLPTAPTTNTSIPVLSGALALSPNVWVALGTPSTRFIVWDAIPDFSQLPASTLGSLTIQDMQSSACSPGCSSAGNCTSAGTCKCSARFSGASCETCASGFFGPNCLACPANCEICDDGITGTGRCMKPSVSNAPSTCKCKNGVCGANGQCACNSGFTTGNDGTLCSKCMPGFFQTSAGDCQVCQLGCTQCADGTGECTTCKSGFSKNSNDKTKCNAPPSLDSSKNACPDGSFGNGQGPCTPCAPSCQTCSGGTSNDCILCGLGTFALNGVCVPVNTDGVCSGSNFIADNNKRECDSCGATCIRCKIPNFGLASTVDQKQCTQCLPGLFLSNGACVLSCPAGTTISSQDNVTCIPCDSSCTSCSGTSTFCMTCPNNQLAFNGKCIASCPSSTFSTSGKCLTCHGDCASCSGGAFNQCTSCPASRPVLSAGRCLTTCSKNQFLDPTSGACQPCDASCSSCSAAGPGNCLACAGSTQRLQGGTCVAANCQSSSNVVPGLGVCLSDLVLVASASNGGAPVPAPTGINTPTAINKAYGLKWWQILLMALGCALIFLSFIWCCCRRRNKRSKDPAGDIYRARRPGWRWRFVYWLQALFTRKPKAPPVLYEPTPTYFSGSTAPLRPTEQARGSLKASPTGWTAGLFGQGAPKRIVPSDIVLLRASSYDGPPADAKLRAAEEARYDHTPSPRPAEVDISNFIDSYTRERTPSPTRMYQNENRSRSQDPHAFYDERQYHHDNDSATVVQRESPAPGPGPQDFHMFLHRDPFASHTRRYSGLSTHSAGSMYSQATGMPRKIQEPRVPQRSELSSRFSSSTCGLHQQEESKSRPFMGRFF